MPQNNSYKKSIDQAKVDIQSIVAELKAMDAQIIKMSQNASKLASSFSATELKNKIKEQEVTIERLNNTVDRQKTKADELAVKKRMLANLTGQEIINNRALAKAADLQARANSKLVGAYQNLIAKREIAKKKLQDEISKQQQNTVEIKKAQKEYDRLAARVNKANAAVSNFSKTGLGQAVTGFKNLMAAFGVMGGVYLFAEIARGVFELTKKLQSLDYALKTVMPEAEKLAQTQVFLKETANKYGASIVALTERYIKFYAAAKQSNFALEDTEKIFSKVTKAAGVLGLRKDELNGVFLALEQMISKGKVTTEELRRQLGERLPGAFGIMANAMGVTVSELDKMLRKGEILSSEALPKFADALEQAYGIENVSRVDTLVAAQERLNNEWIEFVGILSGESGGSAMIGTLDGLASMLDFINLRVERFFEVFNSGYTPLERVQIGVNKLTKLWGIYDGVLSDSTEKLVAARKEHDILVKTIRQEGIEAKIAAEQFRILHGTLAPFADGGEYSKGEFFNFMDSFDSGDRTLADVTADIKRYREELDGTRKGDVKRITYLKEQISLLEKEAELWSTKADKVKETEVVLKGSIAAMQKIKSELEDEQSRLATTTEKWKEYEEKIEDVVIAIAHLESGMASLNDVSSLDPKSYIGEAGKNGRISSLDDKQDTGEEIRERIKNEKEASAIIRSIKERDYTFIAQLEMEDLRNLKSKHEQELEDAKHLSEEKLKILKEEQKAETEALEEQQERKRDVIAEAIELEKELRSDLKDSIIEMGDAILDARVEKVDKEIQLNKEKYAVILDDENLTEEQRSAIEAERDRKEVELEKKKKKRENEAFLFKQGIALAEIGINLARTISAIKLAGYNLMATMPGLFGVGAGLSFIASNTPIAIGTAAAQAAAVVAQSIPKFEKGTDNAPEGIALVDEARPEVHTDKHGNVKSFGSTQGANLRYLERGDKIFKSHDAFFDQFNPQDVERAVWNMNMQSNGQELSSTMADKSLLREISGMKQSNERVWREVRKLASRPINNNVNVNIPDNRPY
jgi:tape measure domain-containing protein